MATERTAVQTKTTLDSGLVALQQIAPSGTSESVAATTAVTLAATSNRIIALATGNITIRLENDGSDVTFAVTNGDILPLRVISAPVTNAVAFLALS